VWKLKLGPATYIQNLTSWCQSVYTNAITYSHTIEHCVIMQNTLGVTSITKMPVLKGSQCDPNVASL